MSRDASLVQQFYGRWASVYDVVAEGLPGVARYRRTAADALALSPGDTVVEMGCGTGANLPYLRERVGSTGRVVGLDVTPEMLARAHARVERHGWRNVDLVQADAATVPLSTEADAVLATFVTGMFADPGAVVEGWLDLLGPGGRVVVLDTSQSGRRYAWPVDRAYRTFVSLSAAGEGADGRPPWDLLDERVAVARATLLARTDRVVDREYALGLVRLVGGQVLGRKQS